MTNNVTRYKVYSKNIPKGILLKIRDFIMLEFSNSKKDEIIFAGIGTNRHIGDSLGCRVGSKLEEHGVSIKCYGTMDKPIHAINYNSEIKAIKNNHPNAFIIACDAAVGSEGSLNHIFIKNSGFLPGQHVNKKMSLIGDVSLVGIVATQSEDFIEKKYDMSEIEELADSIKNIILEVETMWREKR